MFRPFFLFLPLLILFSGCSPESFDDFQREGERFSRQMCEELSEVKTREELIAHLPRIQKLYGELAELLIEARSYQLTQSSEGSIPSSFGYRNGASEQLLEALERIYQIEGGRGIMEKAQQDAAERLARFEEEISL